MKDMFSFETLSKRAQRQLRKNAEAMQTLQHPLLGREQDPNVVNTFMHARNRASNTENDYSPAIWGSCPLNEFKENPKQGYVFEPQLYNTPTYATTVSQQGLITLQDTGVTIGGDPTQPGVLAWGGQDADNDAGIISGDGNVGTTFLLSDSDARELWFEVGLKKSSIGNNSQAFFAGLTEEGMATATDTLLATDSAALSDKDLIGFHVTQAAGATVTFVYNKASAGGVTVKIASLATMVADTWIKLGFWYKPNGPTARRIRVFVNNVEQGTYVTGTNIAAATFPDGEELTPVIAFKKGEATIATAGVRLWRCAQRMLGV